MMARGEETARVEEDALRVRPDSESAHTDDTQRQTDRSPKVKGRGSKEIAAAFGDIVSLLVSSSAHKHFFLADLEWLVLPPLLLKQCQVIYSKGRPVAVAFWAFVSEAVETELEAGRQRLRPAEWKSGDRLWLVELVAPALSGNASAMRALMSSVKSTAPGETFRVRQFDAATGQVKATTYSREK